MLQAVVTYTEELAHEQALAADALLAKGKYLGNLFTFTTWDPISKLANTI